MYSYDFRSKTAADKTAPMLISALTKMGLKPRRYSGRGMYGEECVAVVVDHSDVKPLTTKVRRGGFPEPSVDSMGKRVVLYWPGFPGKSLPFDDEDEDS